MQQAGQQRQQAKQAKDAYTLRLILLLGSMRAKAGSTTAAAVNTKCERRGAPCVRILLLSVVLAMLMRSRRKACGGEQGRDGRVSTAGAAGACQQQPGPRLPARGQLLRAAEAEP